MKTTVKMLVVLTLALATFVQHSTASAGIENQQFVGEYSVTYFEIPGPSACTTIYGYIFGNMDVSKQSGDSAQAVSKVEATYLLYDNCSGTYLVSANGSAQFPGGSGVHIHPSLTRAQINASFFITDYETSALIPVSINVVWTGVGETFSQKIMTHTIGPDYVLNGRYIGSSRSAIPSGTITFGTTTYDLAQASYVDSYFGVANSGFISISHQSY